ncbi:MAG: hypothetical protein KY455_14030 [Euryarchaeota archaeon]|nr:hypothetical protein [Euryarchaeota archaeon]
MHDGHERPPADDEAHDEIGSPETYRQEDEGVHDEPARAPVEAPEAGYERTTRRPTLEEAPERDWGLGLRATGWTLLVVGALLYLFAVWATAEGVLRGAADAAQTVSVGGNEFLVGSVALLLTALGVVVLVAGYFVPTPKPVPVVPGTHEYEAFTDLAAWRAGSNNGWRWGALVTFVVGLLLALYPLRQAAQGEALLTLGAGYRPHIFGMFLAIVGAAGFLVLGARQRPLDELARVTEAHRTLHARRGALEAEEIPGEEPMRPEETGAEEPAAGPGRETPPENPT